MLIPIFRGVARNLLRGKKRESAGDGSRPAGSRGRAPVGSGGEAPRSWRRMLNFQLNKAIDRRNRVLFRDRLCFEKIPATTGGHAPTPLPIFTKYYSDAFDVGYGRGLYRFNDHTTSTIANVPLQSVPEEVLKTAQYWTKLLGYEI